MSKINKIKFSGTSYDIEDKNAPKTVELTQAEYDALVSAGTVDTNTFYIITDASAFNPSNYWTSAQTESAITAAVSGKVNTSAVVSSVTSASTDSEIPTAKAVYDALGEGGGGSITIDPTLDSNSNNAVANSAITNNTLSGGVETNNIFRSVRFWKNNGESAFYKRFAAINGNSVMVDGTTDAPNFSLVGTSAVTSSVTSASTDSQIPTAKAVYDAIPTGGSVSSAITSGDTNAVSGGAVYAKLDEIEQVTARALNQLAEANEVVARALNDLNDRITAIENQLNNS